MAVSVAAVGDLPYYVDGHRKRTVTDVTFDADYASGGEPVTLDQLRLSAAEHVEAQITVASNADGALGHAQAILGTNEGLQRVLLKLWDKTPAEITADDDVSACVVRVTAIGY